MGSRTIIVGGFAKNKKEEGLTSKVRKALKRFSEDFAGLSEKQINIAIKRGEFVEVRK